MESCLGLGGFGKETGGCQLQILVVVGAVFRWVEVQGRRLRGGGVMGGSSAIEEGVSEMTKACKGIDSEWHKHDSIVEQFLKVGRVGNAGSVC